MADWVRENVSEEMYPEIGREIERIEQEISLAQLRKAREFSQVELAQVLHTTQASISKMEKRTDMYISSLRNFVAAMGGTLELIATFPEGKYMISQFSKLDEEPSLQNERTEKTDERLAHQPRFA
ncbi:MAG: XRE family transcriptional regulator [Magnetococcales bacterium]|nr:XRE family transcriptional regulator [Magnetococcales bacterium]